MTARQLIARNFDRAANSYDKAASVQAEVAKRLVQKVAQTSAYAPHTVLDIGCGTGLVAAAAARCWPGAQITAIDAAPAMLDAARRKLPGLQTIAGDIATTVFEPAFDLILSSMALHWMADARAVLARWQKGLKPGARLFAALLADGSFEEWRALCRTEGMPDGLWVLPQADFADGLASTSAAEIISVDYPSAKDFLRRLKTTGAATARPGHKPLNVAAMRRLLAGAPMPFTITYRVVYVAASSPASI